MKSIFSLALPSLMLFAMNEAPAQTRTKDNASVEIAGLILDSETMKPISGAALKNENGEELAFTNSSGYFRGRVQRQSDDEEVAFSFIISKDGYEQFLQKEHWGAIENPSAAFFIGLKPKGSEAESFSEMDTDISDLSIGTVAEAFEDIKGDIDFEKEVESAKRGNEKIFFEIKGAYYIVNNSGWIKLQSSQDKIIINKEKVVSADKLNSVLKRDDVAGMSPIKSELASFEINTVK